MSKSLGRLPWVTFFSSFSHCSSISCTSFIEFYHLYILWSHIFILYFRIVGSFYYTSLSLLLYSHIVDPMILHQISTNPDIFCVSSASGSSWSKKEKTSEPRISIRSHAFALEEFKYPNELIWGEMDTWFLYTVPVKLLILNLCAFIHSHMANMWPFIL